MLKHSREKKAISKRFSQISHSLFLSCNIQWICLLRNASCLNGNSFNKHNHFSLSETLTLQSTWWSTVTFLGFTNNSVSLCCSQAVLQTQRQSVKHLQCCTGTNYSLWLFFTIRKCLNDALFLYVRMWACMLTCCRFKFLYLPMGDQVGLIRFD